MIIKVDRYVLNPARFVAGTRGSYGIEKLDFVLSEEWEGLAVTVSFYPPEGEAVSILYGGEPINIPAEVMNVGGTSRFVVSGYCGERVLISAEGLVRVLDTSVPTENEALVPTPSQASQIMTALLGKVNVAEGKGLSSNDYTNEEKAKLAGIESGAQLNVQSDWSQADSRALDYIKNKPAIDAAPTAGSGRAVASGGVHAALAGKADVLHNHTGTYAPVSHSHAGTYAPLTHSHTGAYAPASHNHTGTYAPISHNHAETYAPASGRAADLIAGAADNLSPVREIEVEDILFERTSASGEEGIELASAELVELEGMSVVQLLDNGNFADASGWSFEGGEFEVWSGTGSITLNPPPAPEIVESDADYLIQIGGVVEVDGYDTGLQYCEASVPGIVDIVERYDGEGWDIEGLEVGAVVITVYEDDFEIDSFTIEVYQPTAAEAVPAKIMRAVSFTAGHKYYIEGEIKKPTTAPGVVLFADGGGGGVHYIESCATDDWQRVSGIITSSTNGEGAVGLWDKRQIVAAASHSGYISSVTVNPVLFSNKIAAFSPLWNGKYRFVYNYGWRVDGVGELVNLTNYGIEVVFSTSNEALRANSEINIDFTFPYGRTPSAIYTTYGIIGIINPVLDPVKFAGALGYNAASGSYVLTYVSGAGWTLPGSSEPAELSEYGFSGTVVNLPSPGAKITVNLTMTEEVISMRRLAVYDLTYLGMDELPAAEIEKIIGGVYHPKGQTNAIVGGLNSTGGETNELDSSLLFTQNYEMCRLPGGICDTLDFDSGKLCRRVGVMTVSGSSGDVVQLEGAKNGTVYLSASGNIGSVNGIYLTLSKPVSGVKVYYELASPAVTNIIEPAAYRVATGGVERILRYDSATGKYVKAALGLRSKIKYRPDYPRQIESDRKKILALFSALGLATSSDPSVIEDASKIAAALSAFVRAEQ